MFLPRLHNPTSTGDNYCSANLGPQDEQICSPTSPNCAEDGHSGITLNVVRDLLESQKHLPVGGRLAHFWSEWQNLGAPGKVVKWLRWGYPLPFVKNSAQVALEMSLQAPPHLVTCYSDVIKQQALDEMIDKLLLKQAVEPVPPGEQGHYSRVFLRPKRTGGWRLIIDLKPLNALLEAPPFKMDTCQHIRRSIEKGM